MNQKKIIRNAIMFTTLLGLLVLGGCGEDEIPYRHYDYRQPEPIDDGWQTDTVEAVGMSTGPLVEITERLLNTHNHEIHSILVVRRGRLVFEEYFPGHDYCYSCTDYHGAFVAWDRDKPHNTHSTTKSFTSTLVGIAIDRGFISGVEERVFDYFPEYADVITPGKEAITLRHMLTMSAGLAWDESGSLKNSQNDLIQLFQTLDPIGFVLGKEMVADPGSVWNYSGGWTNVLGQVVKRATGMGVYEFGDVTLLEPLGITNRSWPLPIHEMEYVSGDLRITPRAMAKLGFLFAYNGQWQGRQIVSPAWIEEATRRHVTDAAAISGWHGNGDGYGYQWWNITFDGPSGPVDAFFSSGWGGNQIIVIRELEMVIVFTGASYVRLPNRELERIVEEHVLAAVQAP